MPRPKQRTEPPFLGPLRAGYRPTLEERYVPRPVERTHPTSGRERPALPTPAVVAAAAKSRGPIAEAVRAARDALGISGAELASRVGVNWYVVENLEKGISVGLKPGTAARQVLEYLKIQPPTEQRRRGHGPKAR